MDVIETYLNRVHQGDCLEVMKKIPDGSIDLVVTSPPYNLKNSTGNGLNRTTKKGKWANAALKFGYHGYTDAMPHTAYVEWQKTCLQEMMRLLREDGAIFYNHKWRVQGGLLQDRQDIVEDFPVRQIIIWQRKGGINFNPGYFLPTYEVVYLIAKKDFKLAPKANRHGDIWSIKQEMKNPHPAPFPVEFTDRIISSTKAQIILDPFFGSGTVALSAMKYKRNYIGIEVSEEYKAIAEERIGRFKEGKEGFQSELFDCKKPLIENGGEEK